MKDDDKLDALMTRWDTGFEPDPTLVDRVRAQAASKARGAKSTTAAPTSMDPFIEWLRGFLGRPAFAAGFAALFVLVGVGLNRIIDSGLRQTPDASTVTYRLSIDPLYRLKAIAGVSEVKGQQEALGLLGQGREPVLAVGLGWLQGELNLSNQQYRRVSALHTTYEEAFDELFLELLATHNQYRQLDEKRMSNDVIDYFELYELLQNQRRLSEESSRLTAELLQKVAEIIGPEQRERYERLLHNLYPNLAEPAKKTTNA